MTYGPDVTTIEDYRFAHRLDVPTLRPAVSAYWPHPLGYPITIAATAGYADGAVPEKLRHAMLLLIADWYAQRETFVVGDTANSAPMAAAVDALINDFRLSWL
jgi:uncharacterized phiE125 gp8 family phage protein